MDEEEFRALLNPAQYRVMREKGTEEAFSGKYDAPFDERGIYTCAACGNFLFASIHKFDAQNGWPAFTKPVSKRNVIITMVPGSPTEISCKKCQSHLGNTAEKDGKGYFQINSIALDFQELPDIELEDGDSSDEKSGDEKQHAQGPSKTKTISLTIGGLTIGAALGASGALYSAPSPICTAPEQPAQASASIPTANPASKPPNSPAAVTPSKPALTSSSSASQPGAGSPVTPQATSSSAADGTGTI